MTEVLTLDDLPWQAVRPRLTAGVSGKTLLTGATRVVLTRVAAGGRFAPHSDGYGHLFLVLAGQGRLQAGDAEYVLGPGSVVRIPAGETHGYRNTGEEELQLVSFNLPAGEEK